MDDTIYIYIIVGGILFMLGYLIGMFKGAVLERDLTNKLIAGKSVHIVVDGEGVSYSLVDGKVITRGIVLEEMKDSEE